MIIRLDRQRATSVARGVFNGREAAIRSLHTRAPPLALAAYLNQTGEYHAVYANIEPAQAWRENVEQGMATTVANIALWARDLVGDRGAMPLMQQVLSASAPGAVLELFLSDWCQQLEKPLVLMLDEVDALVGDTLISLLRQLRAGYPKRLRQFPQTVILCGVRDLQDYRILSSSEKAVITGGSAFNIKARSLRLGDFNQEETVSLLLEHTEHLWDRLITVWGM